jgi:hypothetical protein
MPLSGPGTFDAFFGDASDGDATFTSTTGGTLTKPSFFATLTIGGPVGLDVAGFPIFCRRLVVDSSALGDSLSGAIHSNGHDADITNITLVAKGASSGFFGGGGDGGLGGRTLSGPGIAASDGGSPTGVGFALGSSGGIGGTGVLPNPGKGGVATNPPHQGSFFTAICGLVLSQLGLLPPSGGGGGGGGSPDKSIGAIGGQGGGGGGVVFVCAREIILTGPNPHFAARGGRGGGAAFGSAGGGGGGGGGILLTTASLSGTLKTNVAGGNGGQGFKNGAPGSAGNILSFQV